MGDVHPLTSYVGGYGNGSTRITLVHLSMGDPLWLAWVLGLDGEFIVSYHNIAPAHYFRTLDRSTADLLEFGRRTLGALAGRTILALADSAFNGRELELHGYPNVRVGGLLVDGQALTRVSPDPAVLTAALDRGCITVLHVGQLFPHKRADFLIVAMRRLLDTFEVDATLVLAGATRMPAYRQSLISYIERLGLTERVILTGPISQEAMSAYFRTADILVTASEHEGFCVPLIEAMSFGVPIVARDFAAIPETAAGVAALVSPDAGPTSFAGVVAAVLENRAAADIMRERGFVRARQLSLEGAQTTFLEAIVSVL